MNWMDKVSTALLVAIMFLGVGLMVTQAYLITQKRVDPDFKAPTVCMECHKTGR